MTNTKDHVYNLMMQLVEENKSLWRIKNHYSEEDGNCADCDKLWAKMAKEKAENVKTLEALVAEHLK